MSNAIELDVKRRNLEASIRSYKDEITNLNSNFETSSLESMPRKPIGVLSGINTDVNNELTKIDNLEKIRKELDNRVSNKARFYQISILILGVVVSVAFVEFLLEPQDWECGSGENITTDKLLDGTEDCADGSDESEEDTFWDTDEPVDDAHDSTIMPMIIGGGVILIAFWAWLILFLRELPKDVDSDSKKDEYDSIDSEIAGIRDKITLKEDVSSYLEWEKENSHLRSALNMQINVIETKISSLEEQIIGIRKSIGEVFQSVSHFTPYSDRVIFSEQKILNSDPYELGNVSASDKEEKSLQNYIDELFE